MSLRSRLAEIVPSIGIYRRWFAAYRASIGRSKKSYSQFGEDELVAEALAGASVADGIYIDVGGNHPTAYSNTYKLYRMGFRGVVIEPNSELIALHKRFRPGDEQIAIGCGSTNCVLPFSYSKTPVLSSFVEGTVSNEWKREFLPVFRLDDVVASLDVENVLFLSVDVEGMDLDVLKGASRTLSVTQVVCVEADSEADEKKIGSLLSGHGFQFLSRTACNLLYQKAEA